jgi:hypothetical protein
MDFNNDLRPDIYITRKPTTWPKQLLINTGSRFSLHKAGNAVVLGDFDNDGDQDLYIDQADQLLMGRTSFSRTGAMVRSSPFPTRGGPTDTVRGRGGSMAVADYDNDGFLDIAVTNGEFSSDGWVQLLHNVGNENHWLKVKLVGNPSNRDGGLGRHVARGADRLSGATSRIGGSGALSGHLSTKAVGNCWGGGS